MARNRTNYKKNLGIALEQAKNRGVIPSDVLDRDYVDFDKVRAYLTEQTENGNFICIEEGTPINFGTYVLKKYNGEKI